MKYLKTFARNLEQRAVQFQPVRGSFFTYLIALTLMGIALLARLAIAPVEAGLQYVTFFPAVTLGRGRNAGCPAPPAQIPASGITAQGSCLGS